MLVWIPLAHSVTLVDDRGATLAFERAPQRIVSLLPSLTETVCALGECQRLVGVDRYSNFPAAVQRLPKLGGGMDPSIEAVVALRPDVVLMARSASGVDQLINLGVKVLVLEPKTEADLKRVWLALGQLLQVNNAPGVWQSMEADVAAVANAMPASAKGQRVYFEVSPGPYAASEASFMGQNLARLGFKNIVPAQWGPFPKLNPEFVVRANPDLILVGEGSAEALRQRPGWSTLRALREQRVCVFTPAQADVLVRPSPRRAEAARLIVDCWARLERPPS